MQWWWGLILLGLVALLVVIEVSSNVAMKRLGVEPSPSAKWLRIANLVGVVLIVLLALYFLMSK